MTTTAVTRSPSRQTLAWAGVVGAAFLGYFLLIVYCDVRRPEDPGFTWTEIADAGEIGIRRIDGLLYRLQSLESLDHKGMQRVSHQRDVLLSGVRIEDLESLQRDTVAVRAIETVRDVQRHIAERW